MAAVEVPSEPYANQPPPAGWPKRHVLRAVLPLVLVVIVIVVGLILATDNKSSSGGPGSAHLVMDNQAQSKIALSDKSGKQLYALSYPKNSYINFEASSPKGEVLMSRVISADTYGYIFAAGGKQLPLPDSTAKALNSATYVKGSHQIYFIDENNVVYTSCPAGKSCALMRLNILNGDAKTIVDTGAKPIIPALPPVYPLGVSPDGKTVYVRTLTANKLGKTAAAIYAVNMQGKVSGSWTVGVDADYTPKLSPDAKEVVFKTGYKAQTTINTLDLKLNKTYKSAWNNGEIADLASTFSWSPDSKKVFFWGSNAILSRPKIDSTFPINLGILDVASSKLTNLQTINNSAHNQVGYHGWLDDKTVIYEHDTASEAYVFDGSKAQILRQDLSGKPASQIGGLSGNLKQVIYY